MAEVNCNVHPITTDEYPTPAETPKYSVMEKWKIKKSFGLTIPGWEESLQTCVKEFK